MRPTFKQFLIETEHAEAIIDDLMNSEVGAALANAWDLGDERAVEDILMRELGDKRLANDVIAYMFGRDVDVDQDDEWAHAWKAF